MKRHFEQLRLAYCALLAMVFALGSRSMAVQADDWPMVRGNDLGSGVAAQLLPDKLEVLWTYRAGEDAGFDATPVVAGGIVYVGDNAGTFHAVQLSDGKPVWTKTFADTGFGAAAAIGTDRVYVGDLNGLLRCLSRADGNEIWQKEVEAEIYAGPTLIDESVLVTCEAGTLNCFKTGDGEPRWAPFKIEAPLRCSPTLSAGRVMLAGCDAKLHFIDVASGKEVATVDIDGPTGSTAAICGERAYFGTEGGTFYAIDAPPSGGQNPSVAWEFRDPRRAQPIRAAAAATDHLVVFGSQGKAVYGLDPKTGELKWPQPLSTRSRVESSPVIAGEQVVAATAGGVLYLLDASTGEPKWQYEAGGSFIASPAVVDRRVIIGNGDGTLYCFGAKSDQQGGGDVNSSE